MGAISAIFLLGCLIASFFCVFRLVNLLFDMRSLSALPLRKQAKRMLQNTRDKLFGLQLWQKLSTKAKQKKRADDLERAMPEVLRLLCISLESGSSITTALRYAANNTTGPLADELKRTVWDLDAGQGFDEALDKLRNRTGGSEFAYLAIAMEIQHQSGGSLADILESVSALLKQTSELKDELRTKTEQGRLSSRIVAFMPFILLLILSLFSPGYLSGFLSSPLGVCLFVLALLFEALGIFLVRRALEVDFCVDLEEAV